MGKRCSASHSLTPYEKVKASLVSYNNSEGVPFLGREKNT